MAEQFSFGLKVKFSGKKHGKGSTVYLRNTTDNHNKYYHIASEDNIGLEYPYIVRVDYGKFSTLGNHKFHRFKGAAERTVFVEDLLKKKIKKGYEYYTPETIKKTK
jgi:predicted DNA-binding WGR domain protein